MTKPGRIPCIVPFCRRTASRERFPDCTEIVCARHWALAPRRWRRAYSRAARRFAAAFAKADTRDGHVTFSQAADLLEASRAFDARDRLWNRLRRCIIERAAGIG